MYRCNSGETGLHLGWEILENKEKVFPFCFRGEITSKSPIKLVPLCGGISGSASPALFPILSYTTAALPSPKLRNKGAAGFHNAPLSHQEMCAHAAALGRWH